MTKKHWDEINEGIKKFLKTKNLVDRFNFENATDEMTCTDGILSAWIHSDVEQAYEDQLNDEVTWIDLQASWDVNEGDCLWIRCCCHCLDFDDEEHEQMLDGKDAETLKAKFQDQIQEEYGLTVVDFVIQSCFKPITGTDLFEALIKAMPDLKDGDGCIRSDGDENILVSNAEFANCIAMLCEMLDATNGIESIFHTYYYDPLEDQRNGETNEYTGLWSVYQDD